MASTLSSALFRIDPTEGLLEYVQEVKPYHSKVLDVFVEYVYSEALKTTVRDKINLDMTMVGKNSDVPVTYSCGFGFIWNPYNEADASDLPQATVVSAQGPISIVAVPESGGSNRLTLTPDVSGYTFALNDFVTFQTTGTYPTASTPILPGVTYRVSLTNGVHLGVSNSAGNVITFTDAGTGTLTVHPVGLKSNSFLLSQAPGTPIDVVVDTLTTNQLVMATPFPVTAANGTLKQLVVTGNLVSGPVTITAGDTVYLNGNSNAAANGKFTVASVVVNGGLTSTTITLVEPISLLVAGNGRLNVPLTADAVPYWPAGAAIKLADAGGFPAPLDGADTYYFNPSTQFGVFNLATTRYPQAYTDIVDITSLGTGQLTAFRTEPFIPGDTVLVTGSHHGINDGSYTINAITPEGSNFRVTTLQNVAQTTPSTLTSDGAMVYAGSYGDPYCAVASAPDLYTAAFFSEAIQFVFGGISAQAYLLDTFSGTGDLSTHTVDSGHTWSTFQVADNLNEMVLTGDGYVTTTDTDIWLRSNWSAPSNGNFYVEVDLYVGSAPTTGDPYFRLLAKETNLTEFYGPQVDIYPDRTTGNILVQTADSDGTINNVNIHNTGIPAGNIVTVRLLVIGGHQVKTYVNNQLVYTSATLSYPALTFTGFHFGVPAGDPTQFKLSRILANNT